MSRLANSLVDILVKVGVTEQTGLNAVALQPEYGSGPGGTDGGGGGESDLFCTAFEPEIIAAVSAHAAVFPQEVNARDESYPPVDRCLSNGEKVNKRKNAIPYESQPNTNKNNARPQSEYRSKVSKSRNFIRKFTTREKDSTTKPHPTNDSNNTNITNTTNTRKSIRLGSRVPVKELISSYNQNKEDGTSLSQYVIKEEPENVYPNVTVVSGGSSGLKGQEEENGNYLIPGSLPTPHTPALARNISMRRSFHTTDFARKSSSLEGNDKKIKQGDLPLSTDALSSLTSMCFPDGAYCHSTEQSSRTHFLVLTDINGTKSYAICLIYYTPYTVVPDEDNSNQWLCKSCGHHPPECHSDSIKHHNGPIRFEMGETEEYRCYLPSCLVLISKYPYYILLKDCLSRLLGRIKEDSEDEKYLLKECALLLTRLPVPPAGSLVLEFMYHATLFTVYPASSHDRPVIDFSLELLFQHFSTDKVLLIMNCLLLQQRLLFIGSHYSTLTIICESILHLLYPFRWQYTYVPVLAWSILELIEAPGTFIMGCHSRHREMVEQVQDIVLVNIDEGGVSFIGEVDVPRIPQYLADSFLNACQRTIEKHASSNITLERPTLFTYEDVKREQHRQQQQFNRSIMTTSLELMVEIFRDIIPNIRVEKRFFNKEKFLSGVEEEDQAFYTQVITTELFSSFLKDRMSHQQDQWAMMEERLKTLYRNPISNSSMDLLDGRRASKTNKRDTMMSRSKSLPLNELHQISSGSDLNHLGSGVIDPTYLRLPELFYYGHQTYYNDCVQILQSNINDCSTSAERAPYYYVLGMLNHADGKNTQALELFQRLESCDSRLMPAKLVHDLTMSLTEEEKEDLNKNSVVFRNAFRRQNSQLGRGGGGGGGGGGQVIRPMSVIMHFNKIPKTEMDLKTFTDTVQYLEIAMDQETITRLFNALLLVDAGLELRVLPEVFEAFYKCWKEGEVKCQQINAAVAKYLECGECVLKISETIKCPNYGSGRIGLTQKRLFYITGSGSKSYKQITVLRDIKFIDKIEHKSLFSNMLALKLELKNKENNSCKPFTAVLKEQRDLWYNIVKEMWSGKLLSEEVRDPSLIQLAAQNVLILDAYMQCVLEVAMLYHFSDWREKIESLCYYSERKEENVYLLTEDTKAVLQHRIDPNMMENERLGVECMVYTPGNRSEGGDCDSDPKLWCALSNGKIRIFDASTWIMDMVYIRNNSKASSLLAVGLNQIWVACFDNEIHIIDVRTKSTNQALKAHTDSVAGITKNDDDSVVYSCSLNNEIIAWDTKTYQPRTIRQDRDRQTHVRSIQYWNNCLFCGTKEEVLIYSTDGDMKHRLVCYDQIIQPHDRFTLNNQNAHMHSTNTDSHTVLRRKSCDSQENTIFRHKESNGKTWRSSTVDYNRNRLNPVLDTEVENYENSISGDSGHINRKRSGYIGKSIKSSIGGEHSNGNNNDDIENFSYEEFATYQSGNNRPLQLDCYVITPNSQIWIGCGRLGKIVIYDLQTYNMINTITLQTSGISKMLLISNKIWAGTKDGSLYIFDVKTQEIIKELSGHRAAIRSICSALDRYVVTGSASSEGKVMIWRTSHVM